MDISPSNKTFAKTMDAYQIKSFLPEEALEDLSGEIIDRPGGPAILSLQSRYRKHQASDLGQLADYAERIEVTHMRPAVSKGLMGSRDGKGWITMFTIYWPAAIHKRFRTLRRDAGLSQQAVASAFGISQAHISDMETGKEPMKPHYLMALQWHLSQVVEAKD